MKKSTLFWLVLAAALVSVGWLLLDTFGVWMIACGAVSATAAVISAFRKR